MAARRPARPENAGPAFRPSAPAVVGAPPNRAQTVALLAALAVVASTIAVVAFAIKPSKARSFDLFYGQVYIDDDTSPVAIDLATGKPTVRLSNAFTAVSAKAGPGVDVVPLGGGNTLMLDTATGEFNMVDSTGFVVKPDGGGVVLPEAGATTTSSAVPSGSGAYLLRSSPTGTSVYLVSASTVSSAVGRNGRSTARAYATLARPLARGGAGALASANGGLWVLTSAGATTRAVTELTVPAGSNPGVALTASRHGTVTGPAAVESATRSGDGTGGDVAAVADPRSVQVFTGAAGSSTAPVTAAVSVGGSVDRILQTSNAEGLLVFLYHSSDGWSRVTVPSGGAATATVTPLRAIPPDAQLLPPAQSDHRTYTMDTSGSGTLWQVEADGTAQVVPGAPTYPLLHSERPQLDQSQVLAESGRVIVNSRANYEAEVIFSDGSRAPRAVQKHSAVALDPSGATALADAHAKGKTAKPGKNDRPKPVRTRRPTQTVNTKIDCRTTRAIPHIPSLIPGDRASRSIELHWLYPVLDPADCIPSTYVVGLKLLSPGAPSPPSGQLTVQGQNGVTLTGLFPSTEYELTVTAYLNQQHSTSAPIRVSTGPEGPAAPTGVVATTDSSGNWTVSWDSCGGIQQGCVPSTTWYVLPHYCDGRGLSSVPDRVTVPGDPSVHSFTHVYPGNDGLLGRALCFQVQGVSPQGIVGATSASGAPAYSWSVPDAGALTLTASQPGDTAFGATAATTVDLDLGADPVRDIGGVGAGIRVTLTGPSGAQTHNLTWDGRSSRVSTRFTGITAGAQYTAAASVSPPNHPGNAVTKGPVTVTTSARWPAVTASASCPGGGGGVTLSCTLTVRLSGPASAQANGERFDLLDSQVVCANSGFDLDASGIDPAHDAITHRVDLLQYNGSCTVNVHLVEANAGSGPTVFGGTTSPLISRTVDLGHASTLDASSGDFDVAWSNRKGSSVLVGYTGPQSDGDVARITQNWQENLYAPNGTFCGSASQQPTHGGIYVDVSPPNCVNLFGSQPGWRLAVSYYDRGAGNQHTPYNGAFPGTPPGYVPCSVPPGSFDAYWDPDPNNPSVTVSYTDHSEAQLDGCTDWTYTIVKNMAQPCGTGYPNGGRPDRGNGATSVAATCDTTVLGLQWHVRVSYSGPDGPRNPILLNPGQPPRPPPPPPTTPPTTPPPTSSTDSTTPPPPTSSSS